MTGIDALIAQFDALGAAMVTSIASDAVTASAELLATEWRRVAPFRAEGSTVKKRRLRSGESVSNDYGHLRANIRVRRLKPRRFTEVATIVSTGDAFWARFYEFGTSSQPARPVFRAAVSRLRAALVETQAEVVADSIAAAIGGGTIHPVRLGDLGTQTNGLGRRFGTVLPNGRNG